MTLKDKILTLSAAAGPSGFEDEPRKLIRDMCKDVCDDIYTDSMGNLIAVKKCGREHAKKLMLCAHMDEIGQIITGYSKGFLRFAQIGGVDQRMLPACELKIMTVPPVYGVTAVMPPHALKKEEQDSAVPADQIFIDVGLSDEKAKELIPEGTPVVYNTTPFEGENGAIFGKALDDRACCAITVQIMEEISNTNPDLDVYALFSVQEEVGRRGAVTGAYGIAPDYAIVMDVTFGDQPDANKNKTLALGEGPAIGKGPNVCAEFCRKICGYADSAGMEYQFEVLPGDSGTDGWPIQISRTGVATSIISLPLRYMHTPVEMIRLSDAEAITDLVSGFVTKCGGDL